jgi:hypothetical protein
MDIIAPLKECLVDLETNNRPFDKVRESEYVCVCVCVCVCSSLFIHFTFCQHTIPHHTTLHYTTPCYTTLHHTTSHRTPTQAYWQRWGLHLRLAWGKERTSKEQGGQVCSVCVCGVELSVCA